MNAIDGLREAFRAVQEERPEFTPTLAEAILLQVVATMGGERVHIPKSIRPRIPADVREKAFAERYTGTRDEVADRHGISRATLYRLMQKGTKPTPKG